MCARIGGEADELEGWRDHVNGGSNRKVSQDVSMDLKQLSIKIMEMSGMGVKRTGGTHTVGQKTVPMFGYFAKIEVEQIKKIR